MMYFTTLLSIPTLRRVSAIKLKSTAILFFVGLLSACGGDKGDTTPPVISLIGDASIEIGQGRIYNELGATALDAVDGKVDVKLPDTVVDIDTIGEYLITYQATDAAGNTSSLTRVVNVVTPRPFISTWKTDTSGSNRVIISIQDNNYDYNYSIDWGDGHSEEGLTGEAEHSYTQAGTYRITINGNFPALSTDGGEKTVQTLEQWGDIKWLSMADFFYGSVDVVNNATDTPDIRLVTSFSYMFYEASLFNADISQWDMSNATNLYSMFGNATSFDVDISGWDISNVTDMQYMFNNNSLSTENYDALLLSWSKLNVQSNVHFDAGDSQYSIDAQAARDTLIVDHGWDITDAGLAP